MRIEIFQSWEVDDSIAYLLKICSPPPQFEWVADRCNEMLSKHATLSQAFAELSWFWGQYIASYGLLEILNQPSPDSRSATQQPVAKSTWIYLIRDNDTGYTKIGISENPDRRFRQISRPGTHLPKPCDFTFINAWQSTAARETELHKEYEYCRIRGEWFDLTEDDINRIKAEHYELPAWHSNGGVMADAPHIEVDNANIVDFMEAVQ